MNRKHCSACTCSGHETTAEPLCDGEVRVIYEHGEPKGVRDTTGYLCFFNRVNKYDGQEERYREELALRAQQAEVIAAALRGAIDSLREKLTQTQAALRKLADPDIENAHLVIALREARILLGGSPEEPEAKCAYIGAPQGSPEGCTLSAGHPGPHRHAVKASGEWCMHLTTFESCPYGCTPESTDK